MTDKKKKILDVLVDNLFWLAGCISYSAGVTIFAVPNNLAQSGMTGVAIIVNYLIHTPIGITNFVLNVPLFILAWLFVGKKFTIKTLWVTTMLSFVMDAMTAMISKGIIPAYKGDKLLACIFCGALCGLGLSLAFLRNATTGGTDIIMRLLKRIWPHYSMGKLIMALDGIVVVSAAIVFRSAESALYAAILIFISSRVVDYVMYGAGNGKMLLVFTDKAHEVSKAITSRMTRGVSIVPVEGGYTGEHKSMLICVLRSSEVSKVRKIIKDADPCTFKVITEAREVLGEGFRTPPEETDSDSTF